MADCKSTACYRRRRGFQLMSRNIAKLIDGEPLEDFGRASGDCECSKCGLPYREHPTVPEEEWMVVLCNGKKVKL